MFPPSQLPPSSQLLLLSDSLSSPADFLVFHFIFEKLRSSSKKCFYLGASIDAKRLTVVGTKAGVNVARFVQEGTLVIDDFLLDLNSDRKGPNTLHQVHERLKTHLGSARGENPPLVVIDDLGSLSWTDFSVRELFLFVRALCALAREHEGSLIVRHHSVTPGEPDDLFKHMMQLCAYHLEVRPLASGRSGSVSGEIALHTGPSLVETDIKLRTRKEAIQYRLTETGATYFERGTGSDVL